MESLKKKKKKKYSSRSGKFSFLHIWYFLAPFSTRSYFPSSSGLNQEPGAHPGPCRLGSQHFFILKAADVARSTRPAVLRLKMNPSGTWCEVRQIDIAKQQRWKANLLILTYWTAKWSPRCWFLAHWPIEWAQKERQRGLLPITQPLFTTKLKQFYAALLLNRVSHDALSRCKVIVHAWRQHSRHSCSCLGVNQQHFSHQKRPKAPAHWIISLFLLHHIHTYCFNHSWKKSPLLGSYSNHCFSSINQKLSWTLDHFDHWGYMLWLYIDLPRLALSPSLYWPYAGRPLNIPFQPLVSSAPQIRSGVSQKKSREKKGRGGWQWLAGSVLYVSTEASLYAPVFAFKGPAHFSHREEGRPEGERCFSFSELPGHVCAPTCMVSWVIKPSRWLFELFEPGQYWVTRWL